MEGSYSCRTSYGVARLSAHCLSRADMDEHREICAADDFKKIKRGRMCKAGGDLALFSR